MFSDIIIKLNLLFIKRARSSVVEHYGDIVGVAGSNPAAPTIYLEQCLLSKSSASDCSILSSLKAKS